ncbi:MAG TPA: glycoside hydrolase family 15 protein [Nevskiales bacterium]|nr:glycoside hydrolase family 15 protein [Nevskiales bacterium]
MSGYSNVRYVGRARLSWLVFLFSAALAAPLQAAECLGSLTIRLQLTAARLGPLAVSPDCIDGLPDPLGLIYWTYSPIRGQVGNGGLTVTLGEGARAIGVFWPSPILYDQNGGQFGYETQPQAQDRARSAASGVRFGLRVDGRFYWLDDPALVHRTRYADTRSLRLHQEVVLPDVALEALIESFVLPDRDVLIQNVRITNHGMARRVELVHYENLTPTDLALPLATSSIGDTVLDYPIETVRISDRAIEHGAVHVPVAFALGGQPHPDRRMAGVDTSAVSDGASVTVNDRSLSVGFSPLPLPDAYAAATRGHWLPIAQVVGPANAAQAWDLDLAPNTSATVRVVNAAGPTASAALERMQSTLSEEVVAQRETVDRYWWQWTERAQRRPNFARMPVTQRPALEALFWRSLLVLGMNLDRTSGLLSAGAFRQPPYGHAWPRDTSITAYILGALGYREEARRALRGTAALQRPDGGFGGASYNNGTPWPLNEGLPLTYFGGQVDGTGLFVWAVLQHYLQWNDADFLRDLWPSIRKAGDFMRVWADPGNGGHLASNEEDRFLPGQTIAGDVAVIMGLEAAIEIAARLGETADPAWAERAREIRAALVPNYWREEPGYFAWLTNPLIGGEYQFEQDPSFDPILWDHTSLMWPGRVFAPPSDHAGKTARHMDFFWSRMWDGPPGERLVTEPYNTGLGWFATSLSELEDQGLLRNGRERARVVMTWLARHAAPETNLIGEVTTLDRDYPQSYGAPHSWAHAFAMQGMLAAWPESARPDDSGSGLIRLSGAGGGGRLEWIELALLTLILALRRWILLLKHWSEVQHG